MEFHHGTLTEGEEVADHHLGAAHLEGHVQLHVQQEVQVDGFRRGEQGAGDLDGVVSPGFGRYRRGRAAFAPALAAFRIAEHGLQVGIQRDLFAAFIPSSLAAFAAGIAEHGLQIGVQSDPLAAFAPLGLARAFASPALAAALIQGRGQVVVQGDIPSFFLAAEIAEIAQVDPSGFLVEIRFAHGRVPNRCPGSFWMGRSVCTPRRTN